MQPKIIITPFAENANPATINEIPENQEPGDPAQLATWSSGFPLVTMTYPAAGGLPPFGQDMNGVLNAISAHIAFIGQGGQYQWSDDYVAARGGYKKGAVIQSDDGLMAYVSTIDNNAINFNKDPSSIGIQWKIYSGPPSFASLTGKPSTLSGYGITNAYTKIESDGRYPSSYFVDRVGFDGAEINKPFFRRSLTGEMVMLATMEFVLDAIRSNLPKRSFTGNDFIRIPDAPGGLIIQWGSVSVPDDTVVRVPLPSAFPNEFIAALATPQTNSPIAGNNTASATAYRDSLISIIVGLNTNIWNPTLTVTWLAIGY